MAGFHCYMRPAFYLSCSTADQSQQGACSTRVWWQGSAFSSGDTAYFKLKI
jgi:hypothetical protein